jgi:hypothetical protein
MLSNQVVRRLAEAELSLRTSTIRGTMIRSIPGSARQWTGRTVHGFDTVKYAFKMAINTYNRSSRMDEPSF